MIGVPSYAGQLYCETAMALVNAVAHRPDIQVMTISTPLLTMNRNRLWQEALRGAREGSITHFVFLDSDTAPVDPDWLERLLHVMHKHQATVMAAVVPIKNASGDTNAALETGDPWRPRNIKLAELHNYPETWTAPNLLMGTGLLAADLRDLSWAEPILFHIADRVVKTSSGPRAESLPEDWDLCRQARALGVNIWATTAIRLKHWGPACWSSHP